MKKIKTKRIFTLVAIVASVVMSLGCLASFVGCKKTPTEPKGLGNGTTYYVSTSGKSGNSGTKKSPYDIVSLLNSETILKAGDTVLVEPGVYKIATLNTSERIMLKASGEYNNYISIMCSDPTKECVLDFSAQLFASTNRGVEIYGNYIYWKGIDICGAGDNGMYIGGSYNTVEDCEFYNNRDTGLQLGRSFSEYNSIDQWPSYNLIKNCTAHNNYDNETYGENADGFAAKLTVGYGNVFDGCIAYRNSDDGWDLYAKTESGNIGTVIMYNCVAYENGYLEYTQAENNARFPEWRDIFNEANTNSYLTRDGDGNGFKLGGSVMDGDVLMYNCLSFNNRMHGITDNSNPGVLSVNYCTSYNNSAAIDNNPSSPNFGYIIDTANSDTHANIDLARQTYSYNNVSHVLSVKDALAKSLESDAYRGSVIDSMFIDYKVDGDLDASTKTDGDKGESIEQLSSLNVFSTIPFTKDNGAYTFNITGTRDLYANRAADGTLNPNRAHKLFRNADGSVNMGNILAIKDYSILLGEDNKIGSELNLGSFDEYPHFFARDIVDQEADSEEAAIVARAKETLTLTCDPDALYQDFDLPTKMNDVTITWESSDPTLLEVDDSNEDVSFSTASYIRAIVYRPLDVDTEVTLTATIKCGNVTDTKIFTLNVKQGTPTIGTILASTAEGKLVSSGGVLIVDKGSDFTLPTIVVENGIDYNHKLLSTDLYTLKTAITWKPNSSSNTNMPMPSFNINTAGVYTITSTITLVNDTTKTAKMSYTIYVASTDADVDFKTSEVVVNLNGYTISGTMTNATGILYAMSSATEISGITAEDLTSPESQYAEQVTSYEFRGESISCDFENANSDGYYIYYVVTSMDGSKITEVYSMQINVIDISTEKDFMAIAGGSTISGETPNTTIYRLTKDLDFSSTTWVMGGTAFRGLFNGMGHTISNITVSSVSKQNTGIFYKVDGGTIMNVKFDNISISATDTKTGIVTECTGGYFYNIQITDIKINSTAARVGSLIGQVSSGYVYVEQVSVNNTKDYVIKGLFRVGGLIGFSQNSAAGSVTEMIIKNCWVNSELQADYEVGGIFGTYEGVSAEATYYLEISYAVFTGVITVTGNKTYAGGILGYQKEAYSALSITNCVNVGKIYFNNALIESALKNSSGIVGSSATMADGYTAYVNNCFALMEEFNTNFEVTAWNRFAVILAINYTDSVGLDLTKWSLVYADGSTSTVEEPYVTLNFLGNWD